MSTSVVARGTRERRRSCSERAGSCVCRAGSCVCRGVSAEVSSIWVGEKVKAAAPGRAVTLSATSARPQLCRAQPALSWRPGSSQASCGPSRVSRSKTQVSAGDSLQCPEHTHSAFDLFGQKRLVGSRLPRSALRLSGPCLWKWASVRRRLRAGQTPCRRRLSCSARPVQHPDPRVTLGQSCCRPKKQRSLCGM